MAIRIIAVGKKHESWVVDGIERYQKRLKKPFDVQWQLVPASARGADEAPAEEARKILSHLSETDRVILLDERGTLLDSPGLSQTLLAPLEQSRGVVLVIGGAFGVDASVQARADVVWSLSPLVFPHQMVRLLIAEQIYRAQEIAHDNPYHHS